MTNFLTAKEQAAALRAKEVTSVELVQSVIDNIKKTDTTINAYVSLLEEQALIQARKVDERLQVGEYRSAFAGVPIGLKDNMCLKGTKTTCSSKMLENFVSPYTATAVQQVIDADMIPIGKCNMDEFAMGSSTENSAFFATKNPKDITKVPGGSSGGSAATVSAQQVAVSLGSDTGGSIRQPAAFCGVVGFKPTYGRVSRYGLVAFASSLDQIGPFSHTMEDTAHMLNIICGHDVNDATSLRVDVPDFSTGLTAGIKGLKIAVPEELFKAPIHDNVLEEVKKSLDILTKLGATYEMVSMSSFNAALASYYIIAPAEASANLARFDGVRYTHRSKQGDSLKEMIVNTRTEGFGEEVKRRILIGTFVLSSGYYDAYYVKALKARQVIKNEFDKVFKQYDVILSPSTPTTAFEFGKQTTDPMEMYINDIATTPANMAGLPALSMTCGYSDNLPVGMQLIGRALDEATILRVRHTFQEHTNFHKPTEVNVRNA